MMRGGNVIQAKRTDDTAKFSTDFGNPLVVGKKSAVINMNARATEVGHS